MTEKILFTGKTHTTSGRDGFARSADGSLDIKLPNPHPTAEKLFAAAWSACFIGAIELAASRKKMTLPAHPSIDAEIDLITADDAFFCEHASTSACPASPPMSRVSSLTLRMASARIPRRLAATSTSRSRSSKC
jgi:organic hydroperoxide reductase OsmC/OhrA